MPQYSSSRLLTSLLLWLWFLWLWFSVLPETACTSPTHAAHKPGCLSLPFGKEKLRPDAAETVKSW